MPKAGPGPRCKREIAADDVRPGDAGFDFDERPAAVEPAHVVELAHVEQRAAGEELLAAHGMAGAGDGQRFAAAPRACHRLGDLAHAARLERRG